MLYKLTVNNSWNYIYLRTMPRPNVQYWRIIFKNRYGHMATSLIFRLPYKWKSHNVSYSRFEAAKISNWVKRRLIWLILRLREPEICCRKIIAEFSDLISHNCERNNFLFKVLFYFGDERKSESKKLQIIECWVNIIPFKPWRIQIISKGYLLSFCQLILWNTIS